jgi:hypothetical protein
LICYCLIMYRQSCYDRQSFVKIVFNFVFYTENSFSHHSKSICWSRGGGVVIAPASRSNKRGLKPEKGKIAGGLRARRGSNPFPGAILQIASHRTRKNAINTYFLFVNSRILLHCSEVSRKFVPCGFIKTCKFNSVLSSTHSC